MRPPTASPATWDPALYRRFDGPRTRPFLDLVGRVGAEAPREVADVGCGPGHLTAALAERWPGARIRAGDSSAEMVAAARASGVHAEILDARSWTPGPESDVVVANAVLHWLPDHREVLARWVAAMPEGGWLAVQMPGNEDAPSHTVVRDLLAEPRWASRVPDGLPRYGVGTAGQYAGIASAARPGAGVDAWETTYVHPLTGADPVLAWIAGSALRPVRSALDDAGWDRLRREAAPRLREAYPPDAAGTTWLGFRRVFLVVRCGPGDAP